MDMQQLLENNKLILTEAAIIEQLRRDSSVTLHPSLVNALLIYDKKGRQALGKLYRSYLEVAAEKHMPFILCTPTWRANYERVKESDINPDVNTDAVRFLEKIRNSQDREPTTVKIGGLIGCKNDCYQPGDGLSPSESERFHAWQINQLAETGVDFLIAETLPNIEEAIGIARAMGKTGRPYIISFVIDRSGCVLDGNSLSEAVTTVDEATDRRPLGYMVNCAYPTFLCAEKQPAGLFERLIGYQANASSLDHKDLDGAPQLRTEDVSRWGEAMLELNRKYGVKILGGCCGTGVEHLRYLAGA